MEKKGNRNLPVVKGSLGEIKKDGVSSRPRGCRRRESANGTLSNKNDLSRKPQPQRTKAFDKRPKPRSSYPVVGRSENTRLDELLEPELGSVFLPGSKKQSLNHLLNFTYTPRENCYHSKGRENIKGKMISSKKHRYNKEEFLQANCQFVVNACGDYTQYQCNPDTLVSWDLIEQVNVQVTEFPTCPICLYPPTAAKITRCGHIYCWTCILHYLALSEKPAQTKCPICYETVQSKDLKSLVAIPHPVFNVNESITFRLMKRFRGSLIAHPVSEEATEDTELPHKSHNIPNEVYSKLVLAQTNDVMSIIQREFKELSDCLSTDLDSLEKSFVEQALLLLKDREQQVISIGIANMVDNYKDNNAHFDKIDLTSDALSERHVGDSTTDNYDLSNATAKTAEKLPQKTYYFYQASDGQHLYLHAINARMLEHTYGSLQYGPKTLTGKILEKEGGSMTDDLRQKLRYLQHLPLTCQFEVAEIQLRTPVVSKETLDFFHDQIEARRKNRQRRAKEEKRREKRIEIEENRKMGRSSGANLYLDSDIQFPTFGSEPRLRTESQGTSNSEPDISLNVNDNYLSSSAEAGPSFSGPSFATMLASEKKKMSSAPSRVKASCTQETLITVTGSNMKSNKPIVRTLSDEEDPEGYEPVPLFSKSFGDAVATALEQIKKEEKTGNTTESKKKKKTKQVLFSTSMTYCAK